jgi:hypothetical protein
MNMPSDKDWRGPVAGNTPGRPEFAAEFLRRNAQYQKDYARLARRLAASGVNAAAARLAFARKWGLSFRLCSP